MRKVIDLADQDRQREQLKERQRRLTLKDNQRFVREQIEERHPDRLTAYKNGTGVGNETMNIEEIKFNKDIFDKLASQ